MACWACGRGRGRTHPRWCRKRLQREERRDARREKELAKLIRSQAADMKRGRRNDAQRFGPSRTRTVLLSAFLSFDNEPNWLGARQPWEEVPDDGVSGLPSNGRPRA